MICKAAARDDVYLEQNIQSSGISLPQPVNSLTKFWITDAKVRVEQQDQVIIFDFDREKIFTIFNKSKEFIVLTFKEMESLLVFSNMIMQQPDSTLSFLDTGITKKIKDWDAFKIEAKSEKLSIELWLCEEIKLERSLIIKMYAKMPGMSSLVSALEKSVNYKGFPVLIEMESAIMDTKVKTRVELLKANRQRMDDSLFTIPQDYKQVENPMKVPQNK
jgi:hypothetical protein